MPKTGAVYYRHLSNVERLIEKIDRIRRLKTERNRLLDTGAPLHKVYAINCRIDELEQDDPPVRYSGRNDLGRIWTYS